jgi:hypothetical protein
MEEHDMSAFRTSILEQHQGQHASSLVPPEHFKKLQPQKTSRVTTLHSEVLCPNKGSHLNFFVVAEEVWG